MVTKIRFNYGVEAQSISGGPRIRRNWRAVPRQRNGVPDRVFHLLPSRLTALRSLGWYAAIVATLIMPHQAIGQNHDETPIELSGFSLSQAFEIEDNQPLDLEDSKLQKLIFRIAKTTPASRAKYGRFSAGVSWEQITSDPASYRLQIFERAGRIQNLRRLRLPGAEADDAIKGCCLCDCVSDDGTRFQVLSISAPAAWKSDTTIDQPIRFSGFLYALVSDRPDAEPSLNPIPSQPLFVANRIAWHPEASHPQWGINQSHVALAEQGVDIGQLDFVRRQNSKPLGSEDADIFFQMLAAVDSTNLSASVPRLKFSQDDATIRPRRLATPSASGPGADLLDRTDLGRDDPETLWV